MPDAPDNYEYNLASDRIPLQDMGELAVRVGSPVNYDRRGTVILYDDFSSGLTKPAILYSGSDADARLAASPNLYGNYSAYLQSGGGVGEFISLDYRLSPQAINQIGIEVGVAFVTDFDYLSLRLDYYDGATDNYAVFYVDETNSKFTIDTSGGGSYDLPDYNIALISSGVFHHIKLVVDMANGNYQRVSIDDSHYDLSDYDIRTSALSTSKYLNFSIEYSGRSGNVDNCYLSHVVFTFNEPE